MGRYDEDRDRNRSAQGMGEAHARPYVKDVARLMLFLASDEASFVSGAGHVVDGAMIAG